MSPQAYPEYDPAKHPIPCVGILAPHMYMPSVLMVEHGLKSNHEPGIYGLPGGRFNVTRNDNGIISVETAKKVAVRELWEESGLTADSKHTFPLSYTCSAEMRYGFSTMKLFACTRFSGELRSQFPWEATPLWVSIENLKGLEQAGRLEVNVFDAVTEGLKELNRLQL